MKFIHLKEPITSPENTPRMFLTELLAQTDVQACLTRANQITGSEDSPDARRQRREEFQESEASYTAVEVEILRRFEEKDRKIVELRQRAEAAEKASSEKSGVILQLGKKLAEHDTLTSSPEALLAEGI